MGSRTFLFLLSGLASGIPPASGGYVFQDGNNYVFQDGNNFIFN